MPATSLPLDQVAGVVADDAVLGICREGVEQCDELLGLREPLGMRVVGAEQHPLDRHVLEQRGDVVVGETG